MLRLSLYHLSLLRLLLCCLHLQTMLFSPSLQALFQLLLRCSPPSLLQALFIMLFTGVNIVHTSIVVFTTMCAERFAACVCTWAGNDCLTTTRRDDHIAGDIRSPLKCRRPCGVNAAHTLLHSLMPTADCELTASTG